MGNYSYFLIATNGADRCTIDWDACVFADVWARDEGYHITEMGNAGSSRPVTIAALGEALHDRKLFGYLDNGYIEAIRQVSLNTKVPEGEVLMPRIYFEEEGWQRLHYLEFHPGTDAVDWGTYSFDDKDLPKYPDCDEDGPDEKELAEWTAAERKAHLDMLNRSGWRVIRLLPSDPSRHSALPTLMAMFGIRPEDPGSLEAAAKVIDVREAAKTPLSKLLEYP